jgi:hypothetical protein
MRSVETAVALLIVFATGLLFGGTCPGQTSSGTISGRVLDARGEGVPGASVTLREPGTGASWNFATDQLGEFVFASIQPGTYDLAVRAQGFKTYSKTGLSLSASERLSAGDLKLEIGSVNQTVEVKADVARVQTASSERSALLDSTQVTSLMSRGRDVMQLLVILPGVVNDSEGADRLGSFAAPDSVSGTRKDYTGMNIDGISGQPRGGTTLDTAINMDAVGEVKVLQNSYQAEYGKGAGAIINVTTKSGTRDFHGGAYDYVRNEAFNANKFVNNEHGLPIGQYRYNTFGANIGGPITWPGKFNVNKDKLFFFFSSEILRNRSPNDPGQFRVPTQLERNGDFSQSRDGKGNLISIKDPKTCGPSGKANCFRGSLIADKSFINSDLQKLLSVFPLPNNPDPTASTNLLVPSTEDRPAHQEILRVDYNISSHLKAWFRGTNLVDRNTGLKSTTDKLTWGTNIGPMDYSTHAPNLGGNLTWTISPTLINEFTVGWAQFAELQTVEPGVLNKLKRSSYGITLGQFDPSLNPLNLIPAIKTGVSNEATVAYDARFVLDDNAYTWSVTDGITKIWRQHQFKAGVQWERASYYQYHTGSGNFAGSFDFSTDANNPGDTNYGYANALLGNFKTYTEATARTDYAPVTPILEWYVQDTWRVHPRLTLDLGVRFTAGLSQTPANHLASTFVPALFNSANAPRLYTPVVVGGKVVIADPSCPTVPACQKKSDLKGFIVPGTGDPVNGVVLAGTHGYTDSLIDFQGILAAPRIGFAWAVTGDGKTVLRGGFGQNFNPRAGAGVLGDLHDNPPFISNPQQFFGNASTFLANASKDVVGISDFARSLDRHSVPPRVYNSSLGIQREVGFNTVVDVAYVGSFGRHIGQIRDINQVPYGARFLRSSLDLSSSGCDLANPTPATCKFLNDNFFRLYEGFGKIPFLTYDGNSSYHSLQTQVTRRFSRSLQFGAAWTWSKAMAYTADDKGSVAVVISPKIWNYGLASYDRTHVVAINFLADLPRASRLWDKSFVRAVLNNWQVAGITRFQSGGPLYWDDHLKGDGSVNDGHSSSSFGTGNLQNGPNNNDLTGGGDGWRPAVLGNPVLPKDKRSISQYFNTAAFGPPRCTNPGIACIGNAGAVVARGPGISNWDLSLFKNIKFTERLSLQFRAEAYNAFNHTQFDNVDTTPKWDFKTGQQVNSDFGKVITWREPRIMQFGLRFAF